MKQYNKSEPSMPGLWILLLLAFGISFSIFFDQSSSVKFYQNINKLQSSSIVSIDKEFSDYKKDEKNKLDSLSKQVIILKDSMNKLVQYRKKYLFIKSQIIKVDSIKPVSNDTIK